MTSRPGWLVAGLIAALLLGVLAIPARSQLRAAPSSQDEGLLLVYPSMMLKGAVPNRDFESVYGSASLWAVAAAFRVSAESVVSERAVGLLYHLVLVGALAALAWRRRGRLAALFAGLVSAVLLAPLGLAAFAWIGALAAGAVALLLFDVALTKRSERVWHLAAGVCLGLALSFRLDFGLAVALTLVVLAATRPRGLRAALLGIIVGLLPLVINLGEAGPRAVVRGQVAQPIFTTGPGRRLPLSGLHRSELLLLGLCVIVAFTWGAIGAVNLLRDRSDRLGAISLIIGAFEIGILPQAFQRADSVHLCYVACLILATGVMLPWTLGGRLPVWAWPAFAGTAILVLAFPVSGRTYRVQALRGLGVRADPEYLVTHDGRSLPVGTASDQKDLGGLLDAVDANSRPGGRIFVGPHDLRRTNYNDTFLYFLLPKLHPSSFYLEMEPGVANATTAPLAHDLRNSDLLILTTRYDNWNEPNASRDLGPDLPDKIVRSDFTQIGSWGPWELFTRSA